MRAPRTYHRDFWFAVFIASICIHGAFCVQAFAALATGGYMVLAGFFAVIFYPQIMSMIILCPDMMAFHGIGGGVDVISWPQYLSRLAAAYPGSFIYGLVCVEIWRYIRRWRQHEKDVA